MHAEAGVVYEYVHKPASLAEIMEENLGRIGRRQVQRLHVHVHRVIHRELAGQNAKALSTPGHQDEVRTARREFAREVYA